MNYFKNTDNQIFAYDNSQVAKGYGKDMTALEGGEFYDGTSIKPYNDGYVAVERDVDGSVTAPIELVTQLQVEADTKVLNDWKANRQAQVDAIVVTTTSGKQFDGDEISQARMARTWPLLELDTDTTEWSLADTPTGVMTQVTKAELKEACLLAGQEQTRLWSI